MFDRHSKLLRGLLYFGFLSFRLSAGSEEAKPVALEALINKPEEQDIALAKIFKFRGKLAFLAQNNMYAKVMDALKDRIDECKELSPGWSSEATFLIPRELLINAIRFLYRYVPYSHGNEIIFDILKKESAPEPDFSSEGGLSTEDPFEGRFFLKKIGCGYKLFGSTGMINPKGPYMHLSSYWINRIFEPTVLDADVREVIANRFGKNSIFVKRYPDNEHLIFIAPRTLVRYILPFFYVRCVQVVAAQLLKIDSLDREDICYHYKRCTGSYDPRNAPLYYTGIFTQFTAIRELRERMKELKPLSSERLGEKSVLYEWKKSINYQESDNSPSALQENYKVPIFNYRYIFCALMPAWRSPTSLTMSNDRLDFTFTIEEENKAQLIANIYQFYLDPRYRSAGVIEFLEEIYQRGAGKSNDAFCLTQDAQRRGNLWLSDHIKRLKHDKSIRNFLTKFGLQSSALLYEFLKSPGVCRSHSENECDNQVMFPLDFLYTRLAPKHVAKSSLLKDGMGPQR